MIDGKPKPLNVNKGELSYATPDKGSFKITEIKTYKLVPAPAGKPATQQYAEWVVQPDAIGEHWVCDGKSVYEFRSDQKQVIERPLPPRAPGESIIDGPLPFLFGAEKEKLKSRYWMKIDEQSQDPNQIWLTAWPKFQAQAADITTVEVILDRQLQLPQAMRVTMPNHDYHVYKFDIGQAKVNGVLDRIQQTFFERPRTPVGWKLVLENAPVAQLPPVQNAPQSR
jgi:TIGR03009 family protein